MHATRQRSAGEAGFTLVEMLVSLFAMAILIVAILTLFDATNKLNRVQTQIAEMQQSLRVAQYDVTRTVRIAGRGGLRNGILPQGIALSLRNNVAAGAKLAIGDPSPQNPVVVTGTDVLTVRAVISTPLYQINYTVPGQFQLADADDPGNPTPAPNVSETGTIHICDTSSTGIAQNLTPLRDLIARAAAGTAIHEALVMVSPLDDTIYGVVEFLPEGSLPTSALCVIGDPSQGVTIAFRAVSEDGGGGTDRSDIYRGLSSAGVGENLPSALTSVIMLGVLEEYRYYVRDELATIGPIANYPSPRLARARFFPNTEVPYAGDLGNLRADLADDILDFQVALGIDRDNDGQIADAGDDTDEWLFNHEDDEADPLLGGWSNQPLFYVRVDTLARTDRPDTNYSAPALSRIEDRVYAPTATENDRIARLFRRRLLQTVIDPRNL